MINKTLRNKLSKHLKTSFLKDVIAILTKKNIVNKNGQPFSRAYVSYVYNGKNENIDIELAIIEVYNQKKSQYKSNVESKKILLK
jgi:protein-disulfide isomerase-like protein with CxxC motif